MSVETNESQLQDALFDVSSESASSIPETTWEDLRGYVDSRVDSRQYSDLSKERQQQIDREIEDLVDKGHADYGEATAQIYERYGLMPANEEEYVQAVDATPRVDTGVSERTITCGDCGAEVSSGHGCMHMRLSRSGRLISSDDFLFNSRRRRR